MLGASWVVQCLLTVELQRPSSCRLLSAAGQKRANWDNRVRKEGGGPDGEDDPNWK